jgi:hypothetical protein
MTFVLSVESKLYVLSVVMLNVVKLSVSTLSVVMLSVIMLSVIMLSVVMPNVVALFVGGNANCFEWAWFRKKVKNFSVFKI